MTSFQPPLLPIQRVTARGRCPAAGPGPAVGMGTHLRGKINKSWPGDVKYKYGGARMPVKKSWGTSSFRHTVYAAAGQEIANDGLVHATYSAKVTMTPPPGWALEVPNGGSVFVLPPRWDKATYLPNRAKGAGNFAVSVALPYSKKRGAPEEHVAKRIDKAFRTPGRRSRRTCGSCCRDRTLTSS